jgi:hypothetical protein
MLGDFAATNKQTPEPKESVTWTKPVGVDSRSQMSW